MNNHYAFIKLQQILSKRIARELNIMDNSKQWPRHFYEKASKKISEKIEASILLSESDRAVIGGYISSSTLERVLKYGYQVPENIDKRRLNTLNKLSIYLDYKNWAAFNKNVEPIVDIEKVKQIIHLANEAEFKAYLTLPAVQLKPLSKYFCTESPAYKKIKNILINLSDKNWTLRNHTATSYYEILNIEIIKDSATEIHLTANECWYLKWYDNYSGEVVHLYNEHNDQLYIVALIDGNWKIKTNHYPANFN